MGGGRAGKSDGRSDVVAAAEGTALSGDVAAEAEGPFLASACCFFLLNSSSCSQ